jgi:lipopolysaccharide export system protein LptA
MTAVKRVIILAVWVLAAMATTPGGPSAQSLKDQFQKGGQSPITIQSKSLEVNDASKTVLFRGDVKATKDEFVMDCAEMVVYYESASDKGDSDKSASDKGDTENTRTRIDRIVAKGGVRITRAQGGMATADEAVYFQMEEKVVLTGRPVVKQGKDFVEGDRITILLKENRSIVESNEDSKVKAVIFQGGEKGKPL